MNELSEDGRTIAADGGQGTAQGRRRASLPVGVFLLLLFAVILIPALVFSIVLLQRNNEAQQEVALTLAEATAGSIAETVDRELSGMLTTLRVLSTATSLAENDMADFHLRAQTALTNTNDFMIVLDEDMQQLINTRVPYGTPLSPTSDPETAQAALESGEPAISDMFFGQTSQKWVFNVIMPWHIGVSPIALVLTKNAEDLSAALAGRNLRGGWNAAVIDREGKVLASSYLSSDIGNEFFLDSGTPTSSTRMRQRIPHEGEIYQTITTNSQMSGWRVVLWASTAIIEQPMRRSMQTFLVGGLAMVLIGAAMAWLLAHQIARPVRRLARDARLLGAGEMVKATDYPVTEIRTVSEALEQAAHERQKAESEIRFLMREVAHRSKNQLTVVSSIAKQTARNSANFDEFQDSFQKRVQGLARSTDLLIEGGVAGVEMLALLRAQIEPFRPDEDSRLKMTGPLVRLSNQAAQTMGLAFHEMATNAAKYGAFASRQGNLEVTWKLTNDDIELVWRERVETLINSGQERGFGTEVVERMVGGTLDAAIERTLHADGIEYRFTIPRQKVRPGADH
ncbi:MAG: sensor histidine kinase [Rhizobiaceae bacterium]